MAESNFDRLAGKLAGRPGVTNPKGLAAAIGRKKFGKKTMAKAASQGEPAVVAQKQQQQGGSGSSSSGSSGGAY